LFSQQAIDYSRGCNRLERQKCKLKKIAPGVQTHDKLAQTQEYSKFEFQIVQSILISQTGQTGTGRLF